MPIRHPVHIVEKTHTLKKAERELEQTLGRAPTVGELSDVLHMTQEQIAFLYCVQGTPDSLDRMVGEDEALRVKALRFSGLKNR